MRTTIELSLGAPGKETVAYTTSVINTADLLQALTSKNYSPIQWKGTRCSENFSRATGFAADIDGELTLDEAKKRIEDKKLHAYVVTTRNHQIEKKNDKGEVVAPACDRFRVIIPFDRVVLTVENYQGIINRIVDEIFPECDPAVLEGGRQFFPSPVGCVHVDYFSHSGYQDYRVDDGMDTILNAWDFSLIVKTADGKCVKAFDLREKRTPIWCPFCHDEDDRTTNGTASAVVFNELKYRRTIYCSHCGKTFFSKYCYPSMDEIVKGFYAHGQSCARVQLYHDLGARRCEVSIDDIGWNNAFLLMDIADRKKQIEVRKHLLLNKFAPKETGKVELSDISLTAPKFELVNGVWEVRHPAIEEEINDDVFIDRWLDDVFGDYSPFIRQWLGVFTYENYRRLPFLLLYGPKGSGKTLFANVVASIFPFLSRTWKADDSNFTEWATAKALIADETLSRRDPKQYQRLKQISGQEYVYRNQKHEKAFDVRNNLSVIILSNDSLPVFVEKDELPSEPSNNPFFVLEMKEFDEKKRDNGMQEKLMRRLGHYVRNRLLSVHLSLGDRRNYRFQISTPITPYEIKMFKLNQTSIESVCNRFVERMEDCVEDEDNEFRPYLLAGYIPAAMLSPVVFFETGKHSADEMLRWLAKHKKIMGLEKVRPVLKNEKGEAYPQRRCYELSAEFKDRLAGIASLPTLPG